MTHPRTLIIGLDGATFDLIKPFAQEGYLPTFSYLMDQGVHGPLQAWPNLNSASAWTSIVTGYNPGKHGIYDFLTPKTRPITSWHPTTAFHRKKEPFWRLLSVAGKNVGVINVPISYPADPVHGFMLSGLDAPRIESPGFAHPSELLKELCQEGIEYVLDIINLSTVSQKAPFQLPDSVQQMVEARSHTILYLMRTRSWDAFMAVFVAPDRIQHFFWPNEQASYEKDAWAPIRTLYQKMDTFLDEILKQMDEETTLILISDHGSGPVQMAKYGLNALFERLGFLRYHKGSMRIRGRLLKALRYYERKRIPIRFQERFARAFPRLHSFIANESTLSEIDWSRTQVYSSLSGDHVYINNPRQRGKGVLSEEYETFREQIRNILLNLTGEKTGQPLLRNVHRREDLYWGPFVEQAPDLILEWNYEALSGFIHHVNSEKSITVEPKIKNFARKATHRPFGIFIAYGAHIKREGILSHLQLYDIAPTILYLQNHSIPRDMDGRVLTEIFDEDHLRQYPIQYRQPEEKEIGPSSTRVDEEEEMKIKERLRGLGYIE
jgi:predicted AlkP superfamily phosphohydrolase/phosphomutase